MSKIYNKLVRDLVPSLLGEEDNVVKFREAASSEEFYPYLKKEIDYKLDLFYKEKEAKKKLGHLADVMDLLSEYTAPLERMSGSTLTLAQSSLAIKFGGYSKRTILQEVQDKEDLKLSAADLKKKFKREFKRIKNSINDIEKKKYLNGITLEDMEKATDEQIAISYGMANEIIRKFKKGDYVINDSRVVLALKKSIVRTDSLRNHMRKRELTLSDYERFSHAIMSKQKRVKDKAKREAGEKKAEESIRAIMSNMK